MADDRKSGPVKPPTIELAAKPAGDGSASTSGRSKTVAGARRKAAERKRAAAAGTSRSGGQTKTQAKEKPEARPDKTATQAPARAPLPVAALTIAAALGVIGAFVIAYLVALAGWWPAPGSAEPPPAVLALQDRVAALESAAPDPAVLARSADLATLRARIEALEAAPPIDAAEFATADDFAQMQAAVGQLAETGGQNAVRLSDIEAAAADAPEYASLADIEELRAALETQNTVPGADALARARLEALEARLAEIEAAPAEATGPDQATEERLTALEAAAAAPSPLVARIDAIETAIAELQDSLSELTASAQRSAPEEIERVRRVSFLPLAISELERRVAAGDPFADPLAAVAETLTDLTVPASVAAAAETGVRPAAALRDELAAAAPSMLQALADSRGDADLGTRIMDQIAAAVALRPEGEPEGDDPLSVLARLEAALERDDAGAARVEFGALPPAMRAAAPGLGEAIAALADTVAFVEAARGAALDALATAENAE